MTSPQKEIVVPEAAPPTAVFDIIGTCFSLEKPRQALTRLGAPEHALELWFAQSLRDSFAYSHAGGYAPLKEVLQGDLERTTRLLGLNPSGEDLRGVLDTFAELDPRPDLADAVRLLADRGWALLALTMGAEESTRKLLEGTGLAGRFAALISCDSISITKPNRAAYQLALERSGGETWMVAAHAWDIAGASRAGLRTAFVSSVEGSYLSVYPKPDVVASSLLEAARAMVGR
jgi:2-haloacid dehalogenase